MNNNNQINYNQNNNVKKDNDSKKILSLIVMIAVLMVTTTGATYAFFAISDSNSNTVTGETANASLTVAVDEADLGGTSSGSTKTNKMVPQLETYLSTAMGANYKCVDGNGNTVCKVYTVTVTNGSNAAVRVVGYIQFSGNGSMPNLKFRRTTSATALGSYTTADVNNNTTSLWDLVDTDGATCTIGNITTNGTCKVESIAAGATKTYNFVVWIDETKGVQTDSGTWLGTITFQGENGTGITSTIKS